MRAFAHCVALTLTSLARRHELSTCPAERLVTRGYVIIALVMARRSLPLGLALLTLSCGPGIKHNDLLSIEQRRITYDDMCHLQDYFDQRTSGHLPSFRVVNEMSTETSRVEADEHGAMRPLVLGEGTYVIAARSDRVRFRQLLREEYRRVPDMAMTGPEARVQVKVTWWQAGGIRRVRNEGEIEVSVDGREFNFPPHPCVGEFLFGSEAYAMRRRFMESERIRARGGIPTELLPADASALPTEPEAAASAPDATAPMAPSTTGG